MKTTNDKPIREIPERELVNVPICVDDEYHSSIEDFRDYCENEILNLPETVQICDLKQYKIPFDRIQDLIEEDMYDDLTEEIIDANVVDFDALKVKFEEWMDNQNIKYYEAGEPVKVIWEDNNPLKTCLESALELNEKEGREEA